MISFSSPAETRGIIVESTNNATRESAILRSFCIEIAKITPLSNLGLDANGAKKENQHEFQAKARSISIARLSKRPCSSSMAPLNACSGVRLPSVS